MLLSGNTGRVAFERCLPFLFVALALLIRLPGLFTDLWEDEIFWIGRSFAADSWTDLLTGDRLDGKSLLVDSYFRLLGLGRPDWLYRVPALVAGLAAVLFVGVASERYGRRVSLLSTFLAAVSYLLVYYATEARGYSSAMLASVLTFHSAAVLEETGDSRRAAPLYWLAAFIGTLSHAGYLFALAGALAWNPPGRFGIGRAGAWARWVVFHSFPLALAAAYVVWFAGAHTLGGSPSGPVRALLDFGGYVTGLRGGWLAEGLAFLAVAAVAVFEWTRLRRTRAGEARFLLVAMGIGPLSAIVLAAATGRGRFLYPRYFLTLLPFLLVLVARSIDFLWEGGRWRKAAAAAAAAALAAGSAAQLVDFYRYGRGQYREGIRYMSARSEGDVVEIGSVQNDRRLAVVLWYYGSLRPVAKKIRFVEGAAFRPSGPEWLVIDFGMNERDEAGGFDRPPRPRWPRSPGENYRLERQFPFAGPSGFLWNVYRKEHPPARVGGGSRPRQPAEEQGDRAAGLVRQQARRVQEVADLGEGGPAASRSSGNPASLRHFDHAIAGTAPKEAAAFLRQKAAAVHNRLAAREEVVQFAAARGRAGRIPGRGHFREPLERRPVLGPFAEPDLGARAQQEMEDAASPLGDQGHLPDAEIAHQRLVPVDHFPVGGMDAETPDVEPRARHVPDPLPVGHPARQPVQRAEVDRQPDLLSHAFEAAPQERRG